MSYLHWLPKSPPITRNYQTRFHIIWCQVTTTKDGKKGASSAMPRSILRFSPWIFEILTSYLDCMCKLTEGQPFFCVRQVMAAVVVIFRIVILVIRSRTKKKARLSVCWLVHDQHHVKKHTQAHKIERAWPIHNPPLWQWLGWPSSYECMCQVSASRCCLLTTHSDVCSGWTQN